MTGQEKRQLISQAAKLYTLGLKVEHERDRLRNLVHKGVPYDSQLMLDTLRRFQLANDEWNRLEGEHLALRDELTQKGGIA